MSDRVFSIEALTERDIAKATDHSLLRPELDDRFVEDGCRLAAEYHSASVCVRPAEVRRAKATLGSLNALLEVMAIGVTRVGTTATKAITDDFGARRAGVSPAAFRTSTASTASTAPGN